MNIPEIKQAIENETQENRKRIAQLQRQLHEAQKAAQPSEVEKTAARKAAKIQRYTTNNGLTIHKLRAAGNTVKVTHIRYTDVDVTYGQASRANCVATLPLPSYLRGMFPFNSKGGATYIVVTNRRGKKFAVYSACHELDSFDYKLGVKLALEQFDEAQAKSLLKVTAKMKAAKETGETSSPAVAETEEQEPVAQTAEPVTA